MDKMGNIWNNLKNIQNNLLFKLYLNIFTYYYILYQIMLYQDITQKIIKAAFDVYNYFGYGFLEAVYEKSMLIELSKRGMQVKNQKPINVYYYEEKVGYYIADLLVEGKVIVELKSVSTLSKAHEVKLVNYLTATHLDIGLLINFGESKVEIKRKYRQRKMESGI